MAGWALTDGCPGTAGCGNRKWFDHMRCYRTLHLANAQVPAWPCEHLSLLTYLVKGITGNLPTLSDHDNHLFMIKPLNSLPRLKLPIQKRQNRLFLDFIKPGISPFIDSVRHMDNMLEPKLFHCGYGFTASDASFAMYQPNCVFIQFVQVLAKSQ